MLFHFFPSHATYKQQRRETSTFSLTQSVSVHTHTHRDFPDFNFGFALKRRNESHLIRIRTTNNLHRPIQSHHTHTHTQPPHINLYVIPFVHIHPFTVGCRIRRHSLFLVYRCCRRHRRRHRRRQPNLFFPTLFWRSITFFSECIRAPLFISFQFCHKYIYTKYANAYGRQCDYWYRILTVLTSIANAFATLSTKSFVYLVCDFRSLCMCAFVLCCAVCMIQLFMQIYAVYSRFHLQRIAKISIRLYCIRSIWRIRS